MNPLTTFVRSLGNQGAVANARIPLEDRAREDWLLQGLAYRLDAAPYSDARRESSSHQRPISG